MAQVIVYTNEKGGVSVCVPSGELPIDQVLAKDCPTCAIIIDDSELPADKTYFDAWELIDGKVVINNSKKSIIQEKHNIKQSAIQKLTAIGLTIEEVKSLIGN